VLENWKQFQSEDAFYMIADWHALTTDYETHSPIKDNTYQVALDYLGCGLDPAKCTIFVQSWVKEHAELATLLGMVTPLSWLERCPTYKEALREASAQKDVHRDLHTYGFLGYPVLQTADILLYQADLVPVGEDQLPHLELAREIARRFNHLYKPVFKEPQASLTKIAKLPGTDGRKMSKSYDNCIYISDAPEVIEKKVKNMVTDTARVRRQDMGHPENCNACHYQTIFNPKQAAQIWEGCRNATLGCVDAKKMLAEVIIKFLELIYTKRKEFEKKPDLVADILKEGSRKAQHIAEQTLNKAKEAIGLWV
jgi:tryptophanyl-tRNA synthetase